MKAIITYRDGEVFETTDRAEIDTAYADIKAYTEADKDNGYTIEHITIIV
jgi:hypothetical protein